MKLIQAKSKEDWATASEILKKVIERLDNHGKSLWSSDQVDPAHLQKQYKLDELHFFSSENGVIGMLFIQKDDPLFWPEVFPYESYFIHKLAVLPQFMGKGYGHRILDAALELARANRVKYVRLDCDPRVELTSFYQNYGFTFVANTIVNEFPVVKYELITDLD
ncbi:GNAT family N-acetyltransferase [Cellvibrio sp. NN19]|uniref:GNAT family N-acetyltransferase n=1 Tax=Cellvibrio chitinivorans TaxID=3102792 RepID=UPI002B406819|nr:GNAT family N-acetyltransferase [Cellvibrio sp. NN19]